MRIASLVHIAVAFAVAAFIAGVALNARPASAGLDLSGTWNATYALSCDATFSQMGMALSADVACGGDLGGTLTGSADGSGGFSLSGMFGEVTIQIEGGAVEEGAAMGGTFTAPPFVPSGNFTGERQSGSGLDLTGQWLITVQDVFAGSCTVDIDQSGNDIAAAAQCGNRPFGTLTGTFDPDTMQLSLSGPFGEFAGMAIDGTVAADTPPTFSGTWRITPSGPRGVITGEKQSGGGPEATATPRPRGQTEEPTATAAPSALPGTGSGGAPGGGWPAAPLAAVATLFAAGAATWAAGRRIRSRR